MIDTHCHLTDPRLLEQLQGVLERARGAGVRKVVTIGTHRADWEGVLWLCGAHGAGGANSLAEEDNPLPAVRCALGIHPNYCNEAALEDLSTLAPLLHSPEVVAVGEMGMDYHYGDVPKERQASFFVRQLELARQLKKSAIIHCREAVDDTLALLRDFSDIPAVFHCFTGTPEEARRILDAGYLLGFTGVVTYKNAPSLRDIAALAPSDRILVETDGPYLAPEPVRKLKICEPAFVMHTAAAVAAARNVSIEEIDRITTANAERFYSWL